MRALVVAVLVLSWSCAVDGDVTFVASEIVSGPATDIDFVSPFRPSNGLDGSYVYADCTSAFCLVGWTDTAPDREGYSAGYATRIRVADLAVLDSPPILFSDRVYGVRTNEHGLFVVTTGSGSFRVDPSDGRVEPDDGLTSWNGNSYLHLDFLPHYISSDLGVWFTGVARAQRIGVDGAPIDVEPFTIATTVGLFTGFEQRAVLWRESSYLIVLERLDYEGVGTAHSLRGARVTGDGAVLDGVDGFLIASDTFARDVRMGNASVALLTHPYPQAWVTPLSVIRLDTRGRAVGSPITLDEATRWNANGLGFDGFAYVAAWKSDPDGDGLGPLSVRRFDEDGAFIDPAPIWIDDAMTTYANVGVVGLGDGRSVVVYSRRDTADAPWKIAVRRLDPSPGEPDGGGGGGPIPPPMICSAGPPLDEPPGAVLMLGVGLLLAFARPSRRRGRDARRRGGVGPTLADRALERTFASRSDVGGPRRSKGPRGTSSRSNRDRRHRHDLAPPPGLFGRPGRSRCWLVEPRCERRFLRSLTLRGDGTPSRPPDAPPNFAAARSIDEPHSPLDVVRTARPRGGHPMRDFKKLNKRRQARIRRRAEKLGVSVEEFRKGRREKVLNALKALVGAVAGLTPTQVDDKLAAALKTGNASELLDEIDAAHDDEDDEDDEA